MATDRPAGTRFYTAELLDAFAKDRELAHGEVGAIDSDPVCNCQDWDKLRIRHLAVTPGAAGRVTAWVELTNFGSSTTLTLTLAPAPDGWRIADIGSKDRPSLKASLDESNTHPVQEPPAEGKATPPKP